MAYGINATNGAGYARTIHTLGLLPRRNTRLTTWDAFAGVAPNTFAIFHIERTKIHGCLNMKEILLVRGGSKMVILG